MGSRLGITTRLLGCARRDARTLHCNCKRPGGHSPSAGLASDTERFSGTVLPVVTGGDRFGFEERFSTTVLPVPTGGDLVPARSDRGICELRYNTCLVGFDGSLWNLDYAAPRADKRQL